MAIHASFGFALLVVALPRITESAVSRLRHNKKIPAPTDPLETPNLTGYEPEEVLCMRKDNMQGWCKDWLACIKKEASPAGDAAAVMAAWKPADCEQICGKWPVTSAPEGNAKVKVKSSLLQAAKLNASMTAVSELFHLQAKSTTKDCMTSCKNFQASMSSCVATIVFEPGKTAAMGLPKKGVKVKPAAICAMKDSPCKPTLEVEHQKCVGHRTKKVLGGTVEDPVLTRCKNLAVDYKDCTEAKCPAMESLAVSEYASFTGGCMDQLNAYHAATKPSAGVAAIPGASGCTVH